MEETITQATAEAGPLAAVVDLEDFEGIVRLYQRRIYRVLFLLLSDHEAADSLTQECFLRAYKGRAGFRGEAGPYTWLVRIAVNLAHDHRKNRRQSFWRNLACGGGPAVQEKSGAEVADRRATPEQVFLAREKLAAVRSAVDRLSHRQRTIFLLRFVEEMELPAIARAMNLKTGTVKAHLFRAIRAVREQLREEGHGAALER